MNHELLNKFLKFSYGTWISLIIGFLTTPIITRYLNSDDYGKFSMYNLVTNLVVIIITFGTDQSFVRFFYEEEEDKRSKLLYKSILVPSILCVIVCILSIFFIDKISTYLFNEVNVSAFILIIISIIALLINRYVMLVIRMNQDANLYSQIQVINKVVYFIITMIILFKFEQSYKALIMSTTISLVTINIYGIIKRKHLFYLKGNFKTKNSIKQILTYGLPIMVTLIVNWVFESIGKISIKQFSSYSELGLYASAFSIISLLNVAQSNFTAFWIPVSLERYKNNSTDTKFFQKANELVSIIMIVIAIGLILFKDIIVFLLGPEYRQASYIMPFLVFMPVMYTISEVTVVGINFKKKPKYHLIVAIIACIINVVGNYCLVPKLGARGAAISVGISYIVFYIARTLISKRLYFVDYKLKKFMVIVCSTVVFALYSTFKSFDFIYIIIVIIILLQLILLYKNTVLYIVNKIKPVYESSDGDKK